MNLETRPVTELVRMYLKNSTSHTIAPYPTDASKIQDMTGSVPQCNINLYATYVYLSQVSFYCPDVFQFFIQLIYMCYKQYQDLYFTILLFSAGGAQAHGPDRQRVPHHPDSVHRC